MKGKSQLYSQISMSVVLLIACLTSCDEGHKTYNLINNNITTNK